MIDHPLGILAVLGALVAIAVRLERVHSFFANASAGLLVIFLGAAASNLRLVPAEAPVYDAILGFVAPAAIVVILLQVRLADLRRAGPRVLAAFVLSCVGTIAGCLLGAILLRDRLGDSAWILAGMLTATYTGGSVNFVAVAQAYDLPAPLFGGANAADVAATAIWIAATIVIPRAFARRYPPLREGGAGSADAATVVENRAPGVGDLAALAGIAAGVLALSSWIASRVPSVPGVLWTTTLALLLAQFPAVRRIRGAEPVGLLLIYLFFAAIGAACDVPKMAATGMSVFVFALFAIAAHAVVVFGAGRLLRLPVEVLALASNSTVGGPASAMALARSQGWHSLVLPGVLSGTLGYAVGTYLGVGVSEVLRPR